MKRMKLSFKQRNAWTGRMFVLPWVIGFMLFFLIPFVKSLYYSFMDLSYGEKGLEMKSVGFDNYIFAFTKDPDFVTVLSGTVVNMLYEVPVIVLFALLIGVILNQNFKGRTVARAVFFLPVIVTSGVIITLFKADAYNSLISQGNAQASIMFQSSGLQQLLANYKLPMWVIQFFTQTINNIFNLSWRSGVQILLFIAGLKTIPPSVYEAARVEGAGGWISFWKITLPMISPIILANVIYTVVDSFTDYSNYLMRMISDAAFVQVRYAYSSALSWIYFVIVFIIIGLINALMSRKVFYMTNH